MNVNIDARPVVPTTAKLPSGPMPSRFTLLMGVVAIACSASVLVTYEAGLVFGLLLGGTAWAAARQELRSYSDLASEAGSVSEAGQESEFSAPVSATTVWMARLAMALGLVATLPSAILMAFIFFLAAFNMLD